LSGRLSHFVSARDLKNAQAVGAGSISTAVGAATGAAVGVQRRVFAYGGRAKNSLEMKSMRADRCVVNDDLAAEVDAAWLRQWQRDQRFTDGVAAARLGLSLSSYRRQKTGRSCVTRQTVLLAGYVAAHEPIWLDVAEIAYKLAYLTRGGRPPERPDRTTQMPEPARNSTRTPTSSWPHDRQYPEIRLPSASAPSRSR
jgi:hypothetical protein